MSLDRGFVSVGAIMSGALAEALGPQFGLLIIALICIVFTVQLFFLIPTLRGIN